MKPSPPAPGRVGVHVTFYAGTSLLLRPEVSSIKVGVRRDSRRCKVVTLKGPASS